MERYTSFSFVCKSFEVAPINGTSAYLDNKNTNKTLPLSAPCILHVRRVGVKTTSRPTLDIISQYKNSRRVIALRRPPQEATGTASGCSPRNQRIRSADARVATATCGSPPSPSSHQPFFLRHVTYYHPCMVPIIHSHRQKRNWEQSVRLASLTCVCSRTKRVTTYLYGVIVPKTSQCLPPPNLYSNLRLPRIKTAAWGGGGSLFLRVVCYKKKKNHEKAICAPVRCS